MECECRQESLIEHFSRDKKRQTQSKYSGVFDFKKMHGLSPSVANTSGLEEPG